MSTEVNKTSLLARQPLSALGRTTVQVLVGMIIVCGITSLFSRTLLVLTLIALVVTVQVARGILWAPLLAAIVSGSILFLLFQVAAPYPVYLLTHPKDALSGTVTSFVLFVIIVLDVWFAVVALGISLATFVQNYKQGERQRPGSGRALAALSARHLPIVPAGVWDEDGRLYANFGEPFSLQISPTEKTREAVDTLARQTVMEHIAALLPPALRGKYGRQIDGALE